MGVILVVLDSASLARDTTHAEQRVIEPGAYRSSIRARIKRKVKRLSKLQKELVDIGEGLVYFGVAMVLMGVAGFVLLHTVCDLFATGQPFAEATTTALSDVLFVIIIMEVTRTVITTFERKELRLQRFLMIGCMSAARAILGVGAHLSLLDPSKHANTDTVHLALTELAVNGVLVVGLAATLILIGRFCGICKSGSSEVVSR